MRLDPPPQIDSPSRGFGEVLGLVRSFVSNPLGTTLGNLANSGGNRAQNDPSIRMYPLIVDLNQGTVSWTGRPSVWGPRIAAQLIRTRDTAVPLLEQALRTGVVSARMPMEYRQAAELIAAMHGEYVGAIEPAPSAPELNNNPFPSGYVPQPARPSMPTFVVPPGGFAGFAQQTPANQRAISGGRGRAASGKRRKRKAKAKTRAKSKRAAKKGGRKLKFGSPAWRKKYLK